jgi:hypothetical protein
MASEMVFAKIALNTVYSHRGEVANAHNLYCSGFWNKKIIQCKKISYCFERFKPF